MNTGDCDMANTSLSLGEHWEVFIRNEVSSGRYGSASEVVRDALRTLETQKIRLDALRTHLAEGAAQARAGVFVEDYSVENVIAALDNEG
jgi:antitoxin ParD1/3/4